MWPRRRAVAVPVALFEHLVRGLLQLSEHVGVMLLDRENIVIVRVLLFEDLHPSLLEASGLVVARVVLDFRKEALQVLLHGDFAVLVLVRGVKRPPLLIYMLLSAESNKRRAAFA